MRFENDPRIVMTLDAGGTTLKFSAICGDKVATEPFALPSRGDNLDCCLATIIEGFTRVWKSLPEAPVAISFAFPGPADYPRGIIGDLGNLPCFRGGVALGPMLEEKFKIPVFINNDGDLFVYGEAIAGFLPYVNELLEKEGSPKRYKNLFGVTLGTGFGAGIVRDGELFRGDNICAGEIWLLRNKLRPETNAEEGASIRAVRRVYAAETGIPFEDAPDPRIILDIARGLQPGNATAACEAFRQMGEVVGDALAQALTLTDSLAVLGGGLSHAGSQLLPAILEELNGVYLKPDGGTFPRLAQRAFNLEDPEQLTEFLKGARKEITIPGTTRKMAYDPMPRIGVGISKLGTSEAVAIGAYAFALNQLADSQ